MHSGVSPNKLQSRSKIKSSDLGRGRFAYYEGNFTRN